MRYLALTPVVLLCALGACDRNGLYADRSVPIVAPAASAGEGPRFVGRWSASAAQCQDPWVIEARSLKTGGWDCEFDRVDADSAGYTAPAVCRSDKGPTPVRLSFVAPNQERISVMTVSGGPFKHAVPLERCATP